MSELKHLIELDKELTDEIDRHKYLESQKAGYDLNGVAVSGWFAKHYEEWLRWKKFEILNNL
jgi:hypothetical protein